MPQVPRDKEFDSTLAFIRVREPCHCVPSGPQWQLPQSAYCRRRDHQRDQADRRGRGLHHVHRPRVAGAPRIARAARDGRRALRRVLRSGDSSVLPVFSGRGCTSAARVRMERLSVSARLPGDAGPVRHEPRCEDLGRSGRISARSISTVGRECIQFHSPGRRGPQRQSSLPGPSGSP